MSHPSRPRAGPTSSICSSVAAPAAVTGTCLTTGAGACTGATGVSVTGRRRSGRSARSSAWARNLACSPTTAARRSGGFRSRRASSTRLSSARRSIGRRTTTRVSGRSSASSSIGRGRAKASRPPSSTARSRMRGRGRPRFSRPILTARRGTTTWATSISSSAVASASSARPRSAWSCAGSCKRLRLADGRGASLADSGPALERLGRLDNVHTGGREALEGRVRLVRVVDNARDDDGRRAILEQIDPLGETLHLRIGFLEQVVDRPGDAVALGLPRDDDGVELEQTLDQGRVPPRKDLSVRPLGHFGPEHRVVLRQRVLALDLEVGLAVARDAVEEEGLLDGRDQRVPDPAEKRVVGPDRELVLAARSQPARVVEELARGVVWIDAHALADRRIHTPFFFQAEDGIRDQDP